MENLKFFTAQLLESNRPKFVHERTLLPREKFYQTITESMPQDSQALFLFPEIFSVNQFAGKIPVYHSELKEKEKAEIWESVRNGKIAAIAGTRAALFLPFKNLAAITVDFEENENYTERREPKYDSLEVAEKMASLWDIPLIAMSPAPRVTSWWKQWERLEWREKEEETKIDIINMADERRKGNRSPLAEKALEKIAACLAQNKQALIFINRKGEASAIICSDCSYVFRCQKCQTPETLHSGLSLECHRCKLKNPAPEACPQCRSLRLKPLGEGTERLENEIKKTFAKAKLLRLDRLTLGRTQISEKMLESADVIVATKLIDKPLKLPRLALTITVATDTLLNFPEFRASEKLFQMLNRLRLLTSNGQLIIQTFLPDHSLYQNLQKNDHAAFYSAELETRKSLSLPPFVKETQP